MECKLRRVVCNKDKEERGTRGGEERGEEGG